MSKLVNVLLEERELQREAVGFFGNWAKYAEENKAQKANRYDWRYENSIISGKRVDVDDDYSQWRTNSVLSNHKDVIFFINEVNVAHNITDKMHYDYLYASVRKTKRWSKGETKEEKKAREASDELISLVSEYYKYNVVRAKEVLKILTPEQIDIIRKGKEKGGVK